MREKDAKIQEELMQRMKDHPQLDTSHFHLEVNEGQVILKGRADTEEEKMLAGKMALEFPGVESVKNELHLDLGIIHTITSLVSGIAASNEEELHHKPAEEKKSKDEGPEPS